MKILFADDEPTTRTLMERQLTHWGYDVVLAVDGNEAWQVLQAEDGPQLALLDWMMPGMDGIEVCRRVRSEKNEPYTFIILLTGKQEIVKGLEAGADDFVRKPYNLNELQVRLRTGKRIIELQAGLISARQLYQDKASRDPLTGLWNHEEILGILQHELARSERESSCVGVIMADLDFFKDVNDTHGHIAGDAVLRDTARKMRSVVRGYDFVGRYGGEEFLVILPDCSRECAAAFAERIRMIMTQETVNTSEGEIPITMSLGVSTCCKGNCDSTLLVGSADKALYQAKRKGRNRVEVVVP